MRHAIFVAIFTVLALTVGVSTSASAASDDRPMTYAERTASAVQTRALHPRPKKIALHYRRHTQVANTAAAVEPVSQTKRPPAKPAAPAPFTPDNSGPTTNLVAEARRYIGSGPVFGRTSLWCGRFTDYVLKKTGYRGGGDLASAYASYGRRVAGPQAGAIAVMSRGKHGGHVGIVAGTDAAGNVIVISGNHNNRVAESVYPRSRIYAYVMPHA